MITPGAIEPTPLLWLAAVMFIVLGLWLGRYVPDIWRAGPAYGRMKRYFEDTYGGIQGAAFLASLPIDSAGLIAIGVMTLSILVHETSTGALRSALFAASYVLVPTFVVVVAVFFSVILFGRPKVVIPPHLRSHGGVVPEFCRWAVRRLAVAARDIRKR